MSTTERIEHPVDLRPGDIMFGPISGAVGLGVGLGQLMLGEGFRVGPLSVRHVAIVTQAFNLNLNRNIEMVEAMPQGARVITVGPGERWTDRYAYARLPEDYPGQAQDAAAIALRMVQEGVSYSLASYAALAAWRFGLKTPRLERWINRRRPSGLPVEAICSVLVDQAWSLAGKRVMEGVAHQAVTPGALAIQLQFRPGVIWGYPGRKSNGS